MFWQKSGLYMSIGSRNSSCSSFSHFFAPAKRRICWKVAFTEVRDGAAVAPFTGSWFVSVFVRFGSVRVPAVLERCSSRFRLGRTPVLWRQRWRLQWRHCYEVTSASLNHMTTNAQYTPPTPTRLNSTVESRRRRRCVLGLTNWSRLPADWHTRRLQCWRRLMAFGCWQIIRRKHRSCRHIGTRLCLMARAQLFYEGRYYILRDKAGGNAVQYLLYNIFAWYWPIFDILSPTRSAVILRCCWVFWSTIGPLCILP